MGWAGCCQAEWKWNEGIGARRPLGVKVHVCWGYQQGGGYRPVAHVG